MKFRKQPLPVRLLLITGLLLSTMPPFIAEYITIPDFFRGLLAGVGLSLEFAALILARRTNATNCMFFTKTGTSKDKS